MNLHGPGLPWRRHRGAVAVVAAAGVVVGALAIAHGPGSAATPGAAPASMATAHFGLESTWRLPEAPAEPIDLALMGDGTLYVADGRRNAVLVFGLAGELLSSWTEPPTGPLPGYVYVPRALAADDVRGLVHVLWLRYRAEGQSLVSSGVFLDTRHRDGRVERPLLAVPGSVRSEIVDMALDPASGDLWLCGQGTMRRLRMPSGVVDAEIGVPADARRAAVNADGLIAVARTAAKAVELRAAAGMPLGGWDLSPNEPLDVAAVADGRFAVLVRAPASSASDPATPLVITVDPYGGPMSARAAAVLGAPVPPTGDWPWALAVAGETGALSSGSTLFQVTRYDRAGRLGEPLYGAAVSVAFAPRGEDLSAVAPALALTWSDGRGIVVLDGRDDHLLRFDGLGRLDGVGAAPGGGVDIAGSVDGAVLLSTKDGRLVRFPSAAEGRSAPPDWEVACDCGLGGRLALGDGVVYVTRPRQAAVGVLASTDGAEMRSVRLSESVGLWPSDVAVGADGRLYAADLVRGEVQTWSADGDPSAAWRAGLLSGPRRLAAGLLEDGTEVVVAVMADGNVEVHEPADGNLVARFLPLAHDGRALEPSDVAIGADGRLYIADAGRRAVYVFAPGLPTAPTPAGTPSSTATPSDRSCTVSGDKQAAPDTVVLGHTTNVTLTLAADCPSSAHVIGADIVLVLDRSGSMQGAKIASAQAAARSLAEMLDVRYHRLGLASFSDDASIDVPLTDSLAVVIDGLAALRPDGGTNLAAAVERARSNLEQFGRTDALPVIVLLSDGRNNREAPDPRAVAEAARGWGAQIYTVGLGGDVDEPMLRDIAGREGAYYFAPGPSQLFPIYGEILRVVLSSLAGNLIVDDPLGETMTYVQGSARPAALVSSDRLRWGRSVLPSSGITLTLELLPELPGCWPTNRGAMAEFTDADGARRMFAFPDPTICVVTPTAPPSATPTATVTPSPTPVAVHLPMLFRNRCLPGTKHADVILLIDTSSSMDGPDLEAAKRAALAFVGLLALPLDRAAIVGFSATPTVAAPLSTDVAALRRAIDGLSSRPGTRIDLALWEALRELRGAARSPTNRAVIVLLSDGGHSGPRADVLDLADEVRAVGATVYAIGLGSDADADLLEQIAGHRRRYFHAPTDAELEEIYRDIAGVIPCR